MDAKRTSEMFTNTTCSHPFCLDCYSKQVAVKFQDNISTVKCLDLNCQGDLHLNPEFCHQILPQQLLDRWENALCKSLIIGSDKVYCLLWGVSEVGEGGERREDVMVMELAKKKKWRRCPNCKFYVEKVSAGMGGRTAGNGWGGGGGRKKS
ncbi:hypothetical protein RHSIM_Rhsim13G0104900 [Rhododendron simsii]|uniref:RING-type domain-containing protein n=1 Tax=Rhododendron simsii TaxID=118357 RepID=A0A834FYZ8_RHOSS|nr:hypothetical protein RHSIM_Rhsim13G0104900 [Rhododendron simsii]